MSLKSSFMWNFKGRRLPISVFLVHSPKHHKTPSKVTQLHQNATDPAKFLSKHNISTTYCNRSSNISFLANITYTGDGAFLFLKVFRIRQYQVFQDCTYFCWHTEISDSFQYIPYFLQLTVEYFAFRQYNLHWRWHIFVPGFSISDGTKYFRVVHHRNQWRSFAGVDGRIIS